MSVVKRRKRQYVTLYDSRRRNINCSRKDIDIISEAREDQDTSNDGSDGTTFGQEYPELNDKCNDN